MGLIAWLGYVSFIDEFLETKSFQNKTLKGSENTT